MDSQQQFRTDVQPVSSVSPGPQPARYGYSGAATTAAFPPAIPLDPRQSGEFLMLERRLEHEWLLEQSRRQDRREQFDREDERARRETQLREFEREAARVANDRMVERLLVWVKVVGSVVGIGTAIVILASAIQRFCRERRDGPVLSRRTRRVRRRGVSL